jgi:hypothetical protein
MSGAVERDFMAKDNFNSSLSLSSLFLTLSLDQLSTGENDLIGR